MSEEKTEKKAETVPTWGYAANGEAKIFDLKEGEKLPKGWADTPAAYKGKGEGEPKSE